MSLTGVDTQASSAAVKQTLAWLRKQGFRPVALHRQSKAAIDEKYVDLNYTPPVDDLWNSRALGIGVVTGPKHQGPVDVDLDSDEALYFGARFLPTTPAVFGRPTKPRSHYLYRLELDEFRKVAFSDPLATSRSTIVEMRGDAHQTVMPGSRHETTGEEIVWSDVVFPDVPRCDASVLEFAVKKIAIATLVSRHLWVEGMRNEVNRHLAGLLYYMEWPLGEVESLVEAICSYTGDHDKTRVKTVRATFSKAERSDKITGSHALRALVGEPTARAVDRIQQWAGSDQASVLQDFNERFAVLAIEGKFRIAETMAIERGGSPTFYAKEDFLNLMMTDTVRVGDKPVSKARLWLSNPRRRAYRGIDFIPGDDETPHILNLWSGWAVDPKGGPSCRAWLDLLYYTVCGADDATYNWMLHWFANIVREPKNKSLTAPVVVGRQGAGKSLLFSYFGKILGPTYITITNEEHIYGRFNKHLATTLLLHSEEALYGGERKHRGIIKSLITDEYRILEQKGIDARRVHNYLRLALTSNEAWAAPTEADDRRFTVIDMEGRKADDDAIKSVLRELAEEGPAGLFHYLLDQPYDPMVCRINLKNDALAKMKRLNFDPVLGWWHETLQQGQLLPDCLAWAGRPDRADWPERVGARALYLALVLHLRERGVRYVPDQSSFGNTLGKWVGTMLDKQQMTFVNPRADSAPKEVQLLSERQYAYIKFPPLDQCRLTFCSMVGQGIQWPAPMLDEDKGIATF